MSCTQTETKMKRVKKCLAVLLHRGVPVQQQSLELQRICLKSHDGEEYFNGRFYAE